ncbi:hypothetical protein K491DRAFT_679341 [Lophiostoma macrostomum CBS 122681]|uniref:Uncharacterized protein n=1 Tax=Lophiostoma macrostomum CBS 122681 TaxID=1314788 RepID=A0A6A6T6P9_9PLEO|nr:hypothetical protein K491DRAFT_679341 [Lophiostoma macrostomum CBS 122681]
MFNRDEKDGNRSKGLKALRPLLTTLKGIERSASMDHLMEVHNAHPVKDDFICLPCQSAGAREIQEKALHVTCIAAKRVLESRYRILVNILVDSGSERESCSLSTVIATSLNLVETSLSGPRVSLSPASQLLLMEPTSPSSSVEFTTSEESTTFEEFTDPERLVRHEPVPDGTQYPILPPHELSEDVVVNLYKLHGFKTYPIVSSAQFTHEILNSITSIKRGRNSGEDLDLVKLVEEDLPSRLAKLEQQVTNRMLDERHRICFAEYEDLPDRPPIDVMAQDSWVGLVESRAMYLASFQRPQTGVASRKRKSTEGGQAARDGVAKKQMTSHARQSRRPRDQEKATQ